MRIVKYTKKSANKKYDSITTYAEENGLDAEIGRHLTSIFLLSQNLPVHNVSDFFSGENFSLSESFEELSISYELMKYGFFKQAMVSLRAGFEIGLFSIYWSIKGKESPDFKKWISSNFDTPYKDKKFWKTLNLNSNIQKFDLKFNLFDEIKSLGLSDYVHTKGIYFSTYGKFQQRLKGKDDEVIFREWFENFKQIVKILEIIHLLKFPTTTLRYDTEYLLGKFGTTDYTPLFGGGFGNEMDIIGLQIPADQKSYIEELAKEDDEVKYVIKCLEELPNLTPSEIRDLIIQNQKSNIEMSGFKNWEEYFKLYDSRITNEMVEELRTWAVENQCMNLKQITGKITNKDHIKGVILK